MRAQAIVSLSFPSERHLTIVLRALEPESTSPPTPRSQAQVEGKGKILTLRFEARDTPALRAAISSYLHWIILINDMCSTLDSLGEG
ncbi:MAG: Transcription factor Pcc1 [Candidatus Bathyarchaeota archaeon BA1]|nr:MAG: Transcription factor Pcc1 [Candidatus Bathyarchaeota archaeon BA1]